MVSGFRASREVAGTSAVEITACVRFWPAARLLEGRGAEGPLLCLRSCSSRCVRRAFALRRLISLGEH